MVAGLEERHDVIDGVVISTRNMLVSFRHID